MTKIREIAEKILLKLGVISHELENYIETALKGTTMILSWIKNPPTEIELKALFPGLTDEDYAKLEAGIVEAIKYLTQAEEIITAGTPQAMLTLFVQDMQKDAPGLQKTKIMRIAQTLVKVLDNNKFLRSVYDWLVQGYFTKGRIAA